MKGISDSKRPVIVCPPLKTSLNKVLGQLKGSDFRWAYLGENAARAIALERHLKGTGQRMEIAAELQRVAQSLRQPYIDYIGKLSLQNNSLLWWVGTLSEKNPWISKTFLYACYVRLCQNLLESGDPEAIVLIGESKALRECLVTNLSRSSKGEIIQLESLTHNIINELRYVLGIALYKGYFVVNGIYRLLLAKYYRLNRIPYDKLRAGKGLVLIHTWVDQRSFDAEGKYQETFFGDLAHHLRKKGENVTIIPYVLRTVPYLQIIRKLARSGESFLVPESFWE